MHLLVKSKRQVSLTGRVARPERSDGRGRPSRFAARLLYLTNHVPQNFCDYSHSLCPRPSLRSGRATLG